MTHQEIANHLNRSKSAVQLKSSRLGLKKSKYTYDINFFKEIDNEEKAYWLGFIFADGWVRRFNYQNELGIELQASDSEHLKKFNKSLRGNVNVSFRKRLCNINNKEYSTCSIRFFSKDLIEPFVKYGIINGKSFTMKFPTLRQDLIRHFIRGYFDGDGCVAMDNNKTKMISLDFCSASKYFLESIQKYLYDNNVYAYLYKEKAYDDYSKFIGDGQFKNTYRLYIKGVTNTVNAIHYLYDDCSVYLDRKYHKAFKLIDELNLEKRTNLPRHPEMGDFLLQ